MKQTFLLALLFIFSMSAYTQEETPSQNEESPSQNNEKTGFISVDLGGEVTPAYNLEYYSTVVGVKIGGIIAEQHSFNAGLKLLTTQIAGSFLSFNYAYSFIKGRKWIPGIDISLLAGLNRVETNNKDGYYDSSYYPTIGLELGPYLKTFVSNSFALLLKGGVTHSINTNDANDFDIRELKVYLNLGVQRYF